MMKKEWKSLKIRDKEQKQQTEAENQINSQSKLKLVRLFSSLYNEEIFSFGLEVCLYILKNVELNEYVKLNRKHAPERIHEFATKYEIKNMSDTKNVTA